MALITDDDNDDDMRALEVDKPKALEKVLHVHCALSHKYKRHKLHFISLWQGMSKEDRGNLLMSSSDLLDMPLSHIERKCFPEWNRHDLSSSPNRFLDLLDHRASNSLVYQYTTGFNGTDGDFHRIMKEVNRSMGGFKLEDYERVTRNMVRDQTYTYEEAFKVGEYASFVTDEHYGHCFKDSVPAVRDMITATTKPDSQVQFIVPREIGETIILRQLVQLNELHALSDNILMFSPLPQEHEERPRKPTHFADMLLVDMTQVAVSIRSGPKHLAFFHSLSMAQFQESILIHHVDLMISQPDAFMREMQDWLHTQPEFVPNGKEPAQRKAPGQEISTAVFDAVNNAIQACAVWTYTVHLIDMLQGSSPEEDRGIILQGLSNTCHLNYKRSQGMLRRYMALNTLMGGHKWFRRTSKNNNDGTIHVSLQANLETLADENPQLYYLLRLCQGETTWIQAVTWLQKLGPRHKPHPEQEKVITNLVYDVLGNIAVLVTILQTLSTVVPFPVANKHKGNSFTAGFRALERDLGQLRTGVDLEDFVVPMSILLEPGVAKGAWEALDAYTTEKVGGTMMSLFQDLVDKCMADISKEYEKQKARVEELAESHLNSASGSSDSTFQQRQAKEKTRPDKPTIDGVINDIAATNLDDQEPPPTQQKFKVKNSTFKVFSTLFGWTSASRGSISWNAFLAAMVDLGFAVTPTYGSVLALRPPPDMHIQKSMIIHRPHGSNIEGHKLRHMAQDLKRTYGWDEATFIK